MLTRFLLCVLAGRKKMPFITLNVNQHYSATVNIERTSCCLYCAKVNSAVLFQSLYRRTVMLARQSRHRTAATGGAKAGAWARARNSCTPFGMPKSCTRFDIVIDNSKLK